MFLQKFPPWAVAELKSAIEAAPAAATVTTRDGGGCRRTCSIPEVFPELLRCSNRPGPPGGVREMKNLFMDTFTLLSILISTTELKGVKKLRMNRYVGYFAQVKHLYNWNLPPRRILFIKGFIIYSIHGIS
ncbi:uncharacterized protein LOC100595307 isoform X2 [Nomascus leucogenys]|uniref:uncharacterized protein LOC100595307 isoform X2 n=1 Tax=Nomascus leucogenys TaxID=61853 RepID=UPI00122D6FF4|nr:uncharacterized protein LOC100595307 isoform X2 [Nomascus leucogenys]